MVFALASSTVGAAADAPPSERSTSFAIPAEPLDQALEAYSQATGMPILYDSLLSRGRRSNAVNGAYPPRAALDLLLSGSNLAVRYTAANDIVLVLAAVGGNAAPGRRPLPGMVLSLDPLRVDGAAELGGEGAFQVYAGIVRADIERALDGDDRARPGSYSVRIGLWIDDRGGVARSAIVRSSGDAGRDAAITHRLRQITISKAPPPGMPQPIAIDIRSRRLGASRQSG
jgi:hypothetical protein